jgi:hypothetical protein
MLAIALPTVIRRYAAFGADRVALRAVFTGYTDGITGDCGTFSRSSWPSVGWIGVGVALRPRRRRLGLVSIIWAQPAWLTQPGTALNIDTIASADLTAYLILAPVWACWLGADLLRAPAGSVAAAPCSAERPAPGYERETQAAVNRTGSWATSAIPPDERGFFQTGRDLLRDGRPPWGLAAGPGHRCSWRPACPACSRPGT